MHYTTKCDRCGKTQVKVSRQPTLRQLMFGGFNISMENRCNTCEKEVAKSVDNIIKNLCSEK